MTLLGNVPKPGQPTAKQGWPQIIEGFKGATGVDPMSVISGMFGAKLADNNE